MNFINAESRRIVLTKDGRYPQLLCVVETLSGNLEDVLALKGGKSFEYVVGL